MDKAKDRPRELSGKAIIHEDALNIFTDGSSKPGPRRGGIGILFVIIDKQTFEEVTDEIPHAGFKGASNNQMELLAAAVALEEASEHDYLGKVSRIVLYTDSQYVVSNYQRALFTWPNQKWSNPKGRPIENTEVWKRFVKAYMRIRLRKEIKWVKGHSKKNPHNKRVDKLAKNSAEISLNRPLQPSQVRRKISRKMTEVGSVAMRGQRIKVRILGDQYYRTQKIVRYRYEVLSAGEFFGNVDFIYAGLEFMLKAGHHYFIEVNNETKNPRIVTLIAEMNRITGLPMAEL